MSTEATEKRISGVRKAAILIALFGPETSGKIVKHLTPRQVARLAREVAELGPIEREVGDRVLREFFQDGLSAPADQGGPELAHHILSTASIPEDQVQQLLGTSRGSSVQDILGTLLEFPPAALAKALEFEHPQTTALVLLQIPPDRASMILEALPEVVRAEAILRMATLREVSGEVVGDVATCLQERLATGTASQVVEDQDGFRKTADVLSRLTRSETHRLLEELEQEHPEHVARLRDLVFTFESVGEADDAGLQELLRQIDSANLALALHGSEQGLIDRILSNLSERAGSMLKEEIEYLSNVSPDEQKAARKEIVEIALKLEGEEKLRFVEPDTED